MWTETGALRAPQVIVATGYQNDPVTPDWPGRDRFEGRMLHAAEYRNADPFIGERVLVVGPGCSGMEIADELARSGAAKVWLAVRTPPNMILREGPGGLPRGHDGCRPGAPPAGHRGRGHSLRA